MLRFRYVGSDTDNDETRVSVVLFRKISSSFLPVLYISNIYLFLPVRYLHCAGEHTGGHTDTDIDHPVFCLALHDYSC